MTDSAKRTASEAEADQTAPQADVEQVEPEPVAEAATAHGDGGDGDGAKPDLDDVKRKFREALDRKRQSHADGQGNGGRDTGKIHGSHGPAASRRNFRRKSG